MAKLNEKNENTEKVIHIMVTSLCNRKCPDCCNNQYDLNDIPYVTDEELKRADTICITGGEPFAYSNPCEIAFLYKTKYPNIKKIYVYTNALELANYLHDGGTIYSIDGLTISIKNEIDSLYFKRFLYNNEKVNALSDNLLYVFPGFEDVRCPENMTKKKRVWQKVFVAAPNSIFRKV